MLNLWKRIISLFGKKPKTINDKQILKTKRTMSLRENFISDTPDEEAGGKVNAISQNKTLYIGQFTDAVNEPELFQEATNIKAVFEKFKPNVNVEFRDENGDTVEENLAFNEMSDFDVNNGNGKLVSNSSFLLDVKSNIEINAKMKKQIEQSKRLRDILGDKQSKEELRNVLQNLLDELDDKK
jgi:hypothetical protein